MSKKYQIQKELKSFTFVVTPTSKFLSTLVKPFFKMTNIFFRKDKQCDVKKIKIKTSDEKQITSYIIEPRNLKKEEESPVILYLHGGGFIYSALPHHFRYAKEYAYATKSRVLFVDYRLLPKYRYQDCFDDCYAAYMYILSHASEYHLNPNKIVLAGDSAGGFLSASLFFKLKEKQEKYLPCGCLLIYPALDNRMETPSCKEYVDTPIWNAKASKKMWKIILKDGPILAPLDQENIEGFPSSYIETTQYDCLSDEGKMFAKRLLNNGTKVMQNDTIGTYHGYDVKTKSKAAKEAVNQRIAALKWMLDIE